MGAQFYLDFNVHVNNMHNFVPAWEQDASPMMEPGCPLRFPIKFSHNEEILQSLLHLSPDTKTDVKFFLQKLCKVVGETTNRQLEDFLSGVRYYAFKDPTLKERLEHSLITNLADLDLSLMRRRNCSIHHHSSFHILQ